MKLDHPLQHDSTGLGVATEGNYEVIGVSTHFAVQKMESSMSEMIS